MLTGSAEDEDAAIKLRDKFRQQVAEATAARTSVTLGYLLDEWLAGHQVEETTRTSYRIAIDKFLKPAVGDTSLSWLAQLGVRPFEQLYAELRVCRRRCKGRQFIEHRTHVEHQCDERCAPHRCRPLSVSSVRECHAVLSGALSAALRWGWIAVNPLEAVKRPRQQHPQPDPPSTEEAARIVSAVWEQDADWGTFVWLTFITGARRGELLGLGWEHTSTYLPDCLPSGATWFARKARRSSRTPRRTRCASSTSIPRPSQSWPRIRSAPHANARQSGRRSTTTASCSPTHPTIGGTATRTSLR
jgi:integrase